MSEHIQTRARPQVGHAVPLSRSEAESWLKTLSAIDTLQMAIEIKSTLAAMNNIDMPARRRLEVLETLREAISTINYRLTDQQTGLQLPLSSSVHAEVTLLAKIHNLLALNYSWVAVSFAMTGTRYDTSCHALAIHRAILYFSAVCCDAYRFYQSVPAGAWLAMHELIQKAQEHRLLNFPVTDKLNAFKPQTTITHVYKQILLTSALDPYKLAHGEVDEMHDRCNKWAVHALLIAPPFVPSGKCQFLINLHEDNPGRVMEAQNRIDESKSFLVLDTTQLVVALYEQFQDIEGQLKKNSGKDYNKNDRDRHRMLNSLITAWGGRLKRRSMRLTTKDKRKVVYGFDGVTFSLNGQSELKYGARTRTDIINGEFRGGKLRGQNEPVDLGEWCCIDESANGVQLTKTTSHPITNLIGNLIAVQRPSKMDTVWDVGVVRWMRNDVQDKITIGVYKLGPKAKPVLIQDVVNRSRDDGDQQPSSLSILIDSAEKNEKYRSLVAPKDSLVSVHHYVMHDGRRLLLVQPTTLKLATDVLDWYEFEVIQELAEGSVDVHIGMQQKGAA